MWSLEISRKRNPCDIATLIRLLLHKPSLPTHTLSTDNMVAAKTLLSKLEAEHPEGMTAKDMLLSNTDL